MAAGSVRAWRTSFTGAATRARMIKGSLMVLSSRIAGERELERVALGSAVAREQVLHHVLQLLEELLPLLGSYADLAGEADGRQLRGGAVEGGDVGLHLLHEVEQVAEAELVLGAGRPEAADQERRQPVRASAGLVDAL